MKIRWHREQERGGREPRLSGQHPIVPKKPFLPAVFCLAERFPWHRQGCCPSESCPGTPAGGEAAARRTAHRNPYAAAGGELPKITTCDVNPNELSWNHSVFCMFSLFLKNS